MWKTPRPSTWRGVIWGVHHPITTRYHKDIPGYARSQTEMVYDIGNSTLQEIMMLMQQRMGGSTYPAFLWKMVDLCYDMFSNTKWNFHQNFHQIWFKNGGHIFVSFTQTCVFCSQWPARAWGMDAGTSPWCISEWLRNKCRINANYREYMDAYNMCTYIHTYIHAYVIYHFISRIFQYPFPSIDPFPVTFASVCHCLWGYGAHGRSWNGEWSAIWS